MSENMTSATTGGVFFFEDVRSTGNNQVVTSPEALPDRIDLFIAGGISGCPDWQRDLLALLGGTGIIVANPRRVGRFDPSDALEQIGWEHTALARSRCVSFWFPAETLCPITLLELGKLLMRTDTELLVGCDPGYARRFDVVEQTALSRPDVIVRDGLAALAGDIIRTVGR